MNSTELVAAAFCSIIIVYALWYITMDVLSYWDAPEEDADYDN